MAAVCLWGYVPDSGEWVPVARLLDWMPGTRALVHVNGTEIALFRVGERIYAIHNRCPHRSGPLVRGSRGWPAISCPMQPLALRPDDR